MGHVMMVSAAQERVAPVWPTNLGLWDAQKAAMASPRRDTLVIINLLKSCAQCGKQLWAHLQ
jgi:hypothetical protein